MDSPPPPHPPTPLVASHSLRSNVVIHLKQTLYVSLMEVSSGGSHEQALDPWINQVINQNDQVDLHTQLRKYHSQASKGGASDDSNGLGQVRPNPTWPPRPATALDRLLPTLGGNSHFAAVKSVDPRVRPNQAHSHQPSYNADPTTSTAGQQAFPKLALQLGSKPPKPKSPLHSGSLWNMTFTK